MTPGPLFHYIIMQTFVVTTLLHIAVLVTTSSSGGASGKNTDGSGRGAAEAKARFLEWVQGSGIPGKYTNLKSRLKKNTHPGDLVGTPIYSTGKFGVFDFENNGNGQWPHTKPNQLFTDEDDPSKCVCND